MHASTSWSRTEILELFSRLFSGRKDAFGTYDPRTGRSWQVQRPVTDFVLLNHLRGHQPYAFYPLEGDITSVAVVDFDHPVVNLPVALVRRLRPLGMHGYVERNTSTGYHVWFFFRKILAWKPRAVLRKALEALGASRTEINPKLDRLFAAHVGGAFINAPLFGRLVSSGRTVFVDESGRPFDDQWGFLGQIGVTHERALDALLAETPRSNKAQVTEWPSGTISKTSGLTPCAQMMLREGVSSQQHAACFRLACLLREAGLPLDATFEVLKAWRAKNHPPHGQQTMTPQEILAQTREAYGSKEFRSGGCDEKMRDYCIPACHLHAARDYGR